MKDLAIAYVVIDRGAVDTEFYLNTENQHSAQLFNFKLQHISILLDYRVI